MAILDPKKNRVPEQARPEDTAPVPELPPGEIVLQYLADLQNLTQGLLHEHRAGRTPPAAVSFLLTAAAASVRDDVGEGLEARSLSVYNPSDVTVYVGVGGATPTQIGGAFPIPGKSFVTLPVFCRDLEIAASPADLAGGDIRVWLFRWETVQPAHLGVVP